MRNMVRFGQVITLSIAMPDKPGQLHAVSGICADAGANVLAVEHSRFVMDLAASSARLDITIETRDQAHAEAVIKNQIGRVLCLGEKIDNVRDGRAKSRRFSFRFLRSTHHVPRPIAQGPGPVIHQPNCRNPL